MSGSPIIQNDKLVGAVTHVFVNDPTRGYEYLLKICWSIEPKQKAEIAGRVSLLTG